MSTKCYADFLLNFSKFKYFEGFNVIAKGYFQMKSPTFAFENKETLL